MIPALPDRSDAAGWRRLFAIAVAAMLAIHVADIFLLPWLAGKGDIVIHDDARQFLSWMPRLMDAGALPGDWLADFWAAVSPGAYEAVYRAGAALGIAPTDMARLLSAAMLALAGVAAWRLARAMTAEPLVAFLAAAFLMAFLSKEDAIFSATPRGLAVPAVLFFLEALVRQRWVGMAIAGALLALIYPAPAATLFTMLALSRLSWGRMPPLAEGWRDAGRLLAIGSLLAVLVLVFREQAEEWGPALTLEQARGMAALMTPGARSTIVNESGAIDYVCSMRAGFLPEIIPCGRGVPLAWLANLLFLAPLLWLAWRGARQGGPERIYALALVAGLLWFVLAWIFAFRLHLPSRFSQRILYPLEWLAIGQLLGEWLLASTRDTRRRLAAGAAALFLFVNFATPLAMLQSPSDRRVIDEARAMPTDVRIGGVSEDLQFLPAVAGRAITASPQHAIPWETGYYRRVTQGLSDGLLQVSTRDPAELAASLRRSGADYLLVDEAVLNGRTLPRSYERALPAEARTAKSRMTAGPSLLSQIAPACRANGSPYLPVPCLLEQLTP